MLPLSDENHANIIDAFNVKNRHFVIQERFNKLIYDINAIIKCDILQPVKF